MKSAQKTAAAVDHTPDEVIQTGINTIGKSVAFLQGQIDRILAGKAKSKFDTTSQITYIAAKVGPLVDALRKLQAVQDKRLARLTPAIVMAWLRTLDEDERESFLAEAQLQNARKSGLA